MDEKRSGGIHGRLLACLSLDAELNLSFREIANFILYMS